MWRMSVRMTLPRSVWTRPAGYSDPWRTLSAPRRPRPWCLPASSPPGLLKRLEKLAASAYCCDLVHSPPLLKRCRPVPAQQSRYQEGLSCREFPHPSRRYPTPQILPASPRIPGPQVTLADRNRPPGNRCRRLSGGIACPGRTPSQNPRTAVAFPLPSQPRNRRELLLCDGRPLQQREHFQRRRRFRP